jgi:predicted amidohydrolase
MPDLRIAIGQVRPRKGDYADNVWRLGAVFAQIAESEPSPHLMVFPETVMSGYFVEGGVREVAVTAGTLFRDLAAQHSLAGCPPLDVVVGFYEEFRNRYFNSAVYASVGWSSARTRGIRWCRRSRPWMGHS